MLDLCKVSVRGIVGPWVVVEGSAVERMSGNMHVQGYRW
jgi:hypothetical protein